VPLGTTALRGLLEGNPVSGLDGDSSWLRAEPEILLIRLADLELHPDWERWLLRAVVLRDADAKVIGHCGMQGPPEDGRVDIGYTIAPAWRRMGFASEATAELTDYAAQTGEVTRVRLCIAPSNIASQGVARKLGFLATGTRWDDVDGEELTFERVVGPNRSFAATTLRSGRS